MILIQCNPQGGNEAPDEAKSSHFIQRVKEL